MKDQSDKEMLHEVSKILHQNFRGGRMNTSEIFAKTQYELIDLCNRLITQARINDYLDYCFPSSDHNDIREGKYSGGGYISENIILDRIKELESQL